jgi:hypothetical protein
VSRTFKIEEETRMILPPINVIEETDFRNAWVKTVQFVLRYGVVINFGGPDKDDRTKIEIKTAKDSRQLICLTGPAIQQVLNFEVHPAYFMKGPALREYCEQIGYAGVQRWSSLPDGDPHKSTYNYFELLTRYPKIFTPGTFDQIQILKENLAEQIQNGIVSNRTQAITWQPEKHAKHHEPPCLQRIQVRYLGQDEQGKKFVELAYDWRSRDLGRAWPSNMVCVTAAIYREVVLPNDCAIARIVDYSASLHIYEEMWEETGGIKLIAANPQSFGR